MDVDEARGTRKSLETRVNIISLQKEIYVNIPAKAPRSTHSFCFLDFISSQAISKMPEFDSTCMANIMWAYGTMGMRPGGGLVSAFEGRAVERAQDFDLLQVGAVPAT